MAEGKKTKTIKKEVVVEKKFCTQCGKELNEGEVCNCSNSAVNINTEVIKDYGKGILNTIINMYKKPSKTLEEEVKRKNTKANIMILVIIAISFGLNFIGSFASIIDMLGLRINEYVDIPYFKVFIYMILINFVLSFIPIVVSFVIAKICGGKNYDFKSAIALYATSMAPTIISNLAMAIFAYINILSWLVSLAGLVVSFACFFHFVFGYVKETEISDERKSYVMTAYSITTIVLYIIIMIVFLGSFITDTLGDFTLSDDYGSYNDIFKW